MLEQKVNHIHRNLTLRIRGFVNLQDKTMKFLLKALLIEEMLEPK